MDGARLGAGERPETCVDSSTWRRSGGSDALKQLVDGLCEDLQGELQAVVICRLYAGTVQGPFREGLRVVLADEIHDKLLRAQILSDTIAALGCAPTSHAAGPDNLSFDATTMLQTSRSQESTWRRMVGTAVPRRSRTPSLARPISGPKSRRLRGEEYLQEYLRRREER